jgi:hypothetical protein
MVEKVTFKLNNLRGGGFLLENPIITNFKCNCNIVNLGRELDDGTVIDSFNLMGELTEEGNLIGELPEEEKLTNIGKFLQINNVYKLVNSLNIEEDSISWDYLQINTNVIMADIVGCIKNFSFENDEFQYDTFSTNSRLNDSKFSLTDMTNLNGLVTDISFENNVLKWDILEGVSING